MAERGEGSYSQWGLHDSTRGTTKSEKQEDETGVASLRRPTGVEEGGVPRHDATMVAELQTPWEPKP
jgi:hypothetical protein